MKYKAEEVPSFVAGHKKGYLLVIYFNRIVKQVNDMSIVCHIIFLKYYSV